MNLQIIPVLGVGEVEIGSDLAKVLLASYEPEDQDVLVVTQKVVSKAEGRIVRLSDEPDAKRKLVESESVAIIRRRADLIISQTRHGFICANAGIDLSNVAEGTAALLPIDSDRSASRIRHAIKARTQKDIAVIISDTFGRPFRSGVTDVAIGVAGISAVVDLRGTKDALGRELQVTEVAIADELAAAAELVMGKASGIPAAIIKGVDPSFFGEGSTSRDLVRPAQQDLFR